MTFADRLAYFVRPLPFDVAREVRREKPKNVEDMYFAAREYSRLLSLDNAAPTAKIKHSANHIFPQSTSSFAYPPRVVAPPPTAPIAPAASDEPTDPDAMDLDVMVLTRTSLPNNAGPRCYNCNRVGHISRDCRAPRRAQSTHPAARSQQLEANIFEVDTSSRTAADEMQALAELFHGTKTIEDLEEGEGST
ncbi:hypothetical protein NEOLEDRAFT_1143446 [Neolentinus lepideus HHB14362 ss-1]|uniref:CCHC-type domain-containing protein n=1 Tax=Neolentinus lepideus HHB14362 ss-1 TaxID=1314782 RepID=A0A165MIM0_9AGAM|nr:hypothetical protein NEOLEDRAFT_1143446 [Neolentinus lepideus HHB14362 ss-1]